MRALDSTLPAAQSFAARSLAITPDAPADGGRRGRLTGQLARFVMVGAASTVAYVLLYLFLRGFLTAQAANAISLLVTAAANTAVNRRLTFGIRGRAHAARHQVRGLIAFGTGLVLTSGALGALHLISPRPSRVAEVTVLIVANLAATVVRFGLYRSWVFRSGLPGSSARHAAPRGRATGRRTSPIKPGPAGPVRIGAHR